MGDSDKATQSKHWWSFPVTAFHIISTVSTQTYSPYCNTSLITASSKGQILFTNVLHLLNERSSIYKTAAYDIEATVSFVTFLYTTIWLLQNGYISPFGTLTWMVHFSYRARLKKCGAFSLSIRVHTHFTHHAHLTYMRINIQDWSFMCMCCHLVAADKTWDQGQFRLCGLFLELPWGGPQPDEYPRRTK